MKILGAVIAGGKSTRMQGREKAFVQLDDRPMMALVVVAITPQVDALVINANGDATRFAGFGLPVLPDELPDVETPLAGLHAVLMHAATRGFDAVLSVPSDTPFLPANLVQRLAAAGAPAIAASGGQAHYLTGLWPVDLATKLDTEITRNGMRRMKDFARLALAHEVEWPTSPRDPFANINTPEELAAFRLI